MDRDEVLEKLLSGFSEHVKLGARTWIAIAVLSIYTISAFIGPSNDSLKLPFFEIKLPLDWFALISAGLLAAMVTRWGEAQSRASNTRQKLVEPLLLKNDVSNRIIPPKELWDAQVFLGTATVWSLPASLLGFPVKCLRLLALPYLIFLKVLSISVHYGLPFIATILLFNSCQGSNSKLMLFALYFFCVVTGLQLITGAVVEARYSWNSIKRMVALTNFKETKSA